MKPLVACLLTVLLVIFMATATQAGAASGELSSQTGWQATRAFAIEWDPIAPPDPTEALYEVRDSQDHLVLKFHRPIAEMSKDVRVPAVPDVYTLEAWLKNASGGTGPRSTTTLRFDDTAPPTPEISSPSGWALATQPAVVHAAAAGPPPLSGVKGFAASVDQDSGSIPCAQPGRCSAAEIDLAGDEGGTILLGTLPDGLHFVRVVAVSGAGVPSQAVTTSVRVDGSDPVLSLEGTPTGWSNRPVPVTARASDSLSGMAAAGPLGPFTAIAIDGAAPARTLGDAVSAWVGGSGAHRVEYFARDAAGNVSESARATVRIDEEAPHVAFAATQDPADPERIEATVSDQLSGPSPDRGSIGLRPAGTHAPFEQLPTHKAGDRLVADWDSDAYPPGKYEFSATAYDAAGNSGAGTDRVRGGRMVLVNPLKVQVELTAGLSRRRLTGRLRRIGGGPVPGQSVVVTETFAAGSKPRQRLTVVGTDREGAFALRLRPGPSRDVITRFAGTPLLSRAASRVAQIETATKIHFQASAATAMVGGGPIVFSGKVAHRGTATVAGLPIELQFRVRSGAWSEFRTVEADRRGRFRYPYRFSDDDSRGVRFQFRAQVKGREGWPYGPGTSRPVKVTGR